MWLGLFNRKQRAFHIEFDKNYYEGKKDGGAGWEIFVASDNREEVEKFLDIMEELRSNNLI